MGSAALEAWRKRQKAARDAQKAIVAGHTIDETLSPVGNNEPKKRHVLEPRWKPGESGNPAGRKPLDPEVRAILEAATAPAAKRLAALVDHRDAKVAIQAIDMIYNRIYGRPVQAVEAQVTTTNIQQAHLNILLELQAKRGQLIEGDAQTVSVDGDVEPRE